MNEPPRGRQPGTANQRACLVCGRSGLTEIISLGRMPLANALVTERNLTEQEKTFPLDLAFCSHCTLVQITESVPPEDLFMEYPYFSSYSETMVREAETLVARMVEQQELGSRSLALEVASNDGYLLQHYVGHGVKVLGIDPAANVAQVAVKKGIPTIVRFFGPDVAAELRAEGRQADILHANNVLAHVPDVNGFVAGIATVLKENGIAVIETPYVKNLVDGVQFDTIYHEHRFYYSLSALTKLFERNGLAIVDAETIPIHGGSLRVFAAAGSIEPRRSVRDLLSRERDEGLQSASYYLDFALRVELLKDQLTSLLADLKGEGKRIAAYGAAAKGSVLLNFMHLGTETIDYVVDHTPYKQGRYMPGVRIPIVPPTKLLEDMPDYVLVLAWNFVDEILAKESEYRDRGGRFIIPLPEPVVAR
ncbi:MAG: class I SAM-dependent methyltransferase [Actinomycetota bacterium]